VLLAALWSLQHIFMRVAVPVFGTAALAEGRALFATLFLVPWVLWAARERIDARTRWRDHLAVALTNNVLPFFCFAWAATILPAGYLAILNGMVPLWAAIIAVPALGEPLGVRRVAGFLLGIAGIALIVNLGPLELGWQVVAAVAVGMLGAASWGWAGVVIKQRAQGMSSLGLAAGSIGFAAVLMAPLAATAPSPATWTWPAIASLIALGTLSSGLAYLPFFTLVRDIGPSRTLTVGLAVPLLGILWGWLLLGETVTLGMLAGAALVVFALRLVLRP
jgi:drug/metabolite transporter (DMT)-like permease